MKSYLQILLLSLWCLFAGAVPAYGNNAPQPDGLLTLILIFPVAILGFRFAGAKPTDKERKWRVLTGLVLTLCTLLSVGGTDVALIPLLVIIAYGVLRGTQAMARGQGKKRVVLGSLIVLFTLFGVGNYLTSTSYVPEGPLAEERAYTSLRTINVAEMTFQSNASLDTNQNGLGEYGSLEQLHQAGLLSDVTWAEMQRPVYRYVLVLSGNPPEDERHYFVYATPVHYGRPPRTLSLTRTLLPSVPYARRTFADDETGVVKVADLGGARAVTRAEAEKWPQF